MSSLSDNMGGRYNLHNVIGIGGMGTVYRATDRLTNRVIALKRVNVNAPLTFNNPSQVEVESNAFKVVLANEFQTLASLRHPHIINVLDYGFSGNEEPFFTMDYLPQAATIVEACEQQETAVCVQWLIQTCQALAYLHRHDILHRDLKPANILVANNNIKVLDFGLASLQAKAKSSVGTLAYMAPEVINREVPTEAADLYAIGVIAYQIFIGRLPFDPQSPSFWDDVFDKEADYKAASIPVPLTRVIKRLLAKQPKARYQSAADVIVALSTAIGHDSPTESAVIRESFLQFAKFVGRQKELTQLTNALEQTKKGSGSAWLIGGHSGMGKSRLLRELRTHALINGITVLEGQSVESGELSYQLWRDPLRRLLLTTHLTDAQAAVLHAIIPDLPQLIDRDVATATKLDGPATIQRLYSTITTIFKQQSTPILLILDDLQWEEEGIDVLKQLIRILPNLPLLIVGSYRNDERAQLPDDLSEAKLMTLNPLSTESMATLSASILGETGSNPQLITWLERETEGNAFFLVEVVRLLAEDAGQLSDVGQAPLPEKAFPQGIQTIVQRRLSRVPENARPLLNIAAVAGRQLDINLLSTFNTTLSLEAWLTMGVNTAVLELRYGQWRFTHDKLRAGILQTLLPAQQINIHRQIATAIETLYADAPEQAGALAYHWGQVGEQTKERTYATLAGNYAADRFAIPEAIRHLSRAITLTTSPTQRYPLLLKREQMYDVAGDREAQKQDLATLTTIAQKSQQALVALRRANYAHAIGDYEAAATAIKTAVSLAQTNHQPDIEATAYLQWGKILWPQGKLTEARQQLKQALQMAQIENAAQQIEADSLSDLGIIAAIEGDYVKSRDYFEQALATSQKIGHKVGECRILLNLGGVAMYSGDYQETVHWNKQALERSRDIGNRREEGRALNNLGQAVEKQGDYAQSIIYNEQALQINREIGDKQTEALTLRNLGNAHNYLGNYQVALTYLHQALYIYETIAEYQSQADVMVHLAFLNNLFGNHTLALNYSQKAIDLATQIGSPETQASGSLVAGHAFTNLERYSDAIAAYLSSLSKWRNLGRHLSTLEALAGLAFVADTNGNFQKAMGYVEQILETITSKWPEGTFEPFRIYLICYSILRTQNDPRAEDILEKANHFLQIQASQITDERLRQSFLVNVAIHEEISRLWRWRNL